VPVSRFENNPRYCSVVISPIAAGIVPVSLFSTLTGTIPAAIGEMTTLQYLGLFSNTMQQARTSETERME